MNKAEKFHKKVLKELETYTTKKIDWFFKGLDKGDARDKDYFDEIYRKKSYPCLFYSYLACCVKVLNAKRVVEIGADRGVSALMMASEGAAVCSIDIEDGWEYIPEDMFSIIKVNKDSLDQSIPKDFGLFFSDAKLWLIDGLHTPEQVKKECKLYSPFWQEGTVVIFDDLMSIEPSFSNLPYDKMRNFSEIHGIDKDVGVGILVV